MDKCFKWGKIIRVWFLRPDPEIDFHSGWISFPSRQSPLDRIADLMGFWIAGPFHDHEMGIVVLVENQIVLVHGGSAPPTKIEPRFRIQWIAVSGVTMFVDPCREASILERCLRSKPVKHDSIAVGALDKLNDDLAGVREFVHLNV